MHPLPLFQSAPLTKARGDPLLPRNDRAPGRVSIRSPHQSKGRLPIVHDERQIGHVSIRSPHQSKGRQDQSRYRGSSRAFQSAPLTKARGDTPIRTADCPPKKFQSAPLTKARGDVNPVTAPRFAAEFQSAPLTKARGDSVSLPKSSLTRCFNPLPSPKQGETTPLPATRA